MEMEKFVPRSATELKRIFVKIAKALAEYQIYPGLILSRPKVTAYSVVFDLRWYVNRSFGLPDFYVPLREGSRQQAEARIKRIWPMVCKGEMPTPSSAHVLFSLVDTEQKSSDRAAFLYTFYVKH